MEPISNSSCLLCESSYTKLCTFDWHLRPRSKDLAKGHQEEYTTLEVYLCQDCYNANINTRLIGWDWWDAVDGLVKCDKA